jgi:hypothetical protein
MNEKSGENMCIPCPAIISINLSTAFVFTVKIHDEILKRFSTVFHRLYVTSFVMHFTNWFYKFVNYFLFRNPNGVVMNLKIRAKIPSRLSLSSSVA